MMKFHSVQFQKLPKFRVSKAKTRGICDRNSSHISNLGTYDF